MHIAWFEYFQLICLAIATYCRKDLKACSLGAFVPLLVIVNLTELAGTNYAAFGMSSNYSIYNVYLLVSTPFFFYLSSKMLFLTKKEAVVFYMVCFLCILLVLANFGFGQGTKRFNSYSVGLIEILMIVFSGLCLVRLAILDQKELHFMREPYFWINALFLFSGLITLVVLGLQSYILFNHIEIANKTLYHAILPSVNAIAYAGYSYAFILCRTQRTR